jgi:T-complex protein 1 subunit theta|mmetsp:Transcript_18690/g.58052  ORF Transcript_18690/g.58052 Transcript_18690/m.58052 type:complete len:540 (-) Transcript_18690:859-2478(-)
MSAQPYGLQSMLKDGHKHLSGLDEAVMKNIEACKQLSEITRTSLGPNGMNKMVINHLGKLFVTNDCHTIMTELEVTHPAAKMLVLAAQSQQAEVGDGTNLVITLAGELLAQAQSLLMDGLHTSEVIEGYNKASSLALGMLEELVLPGTDKVDVRDKAVVTERLKTTIASKQYGFEDVLTPLVAEACISVCPKNAANFNVDNVRISKIAGSSLYESSVVKGLVVKRDTEGTVKHLKDVKVAVFGQGVEASSTETKGTVLIESAEQLEGYSRSEEDKMEAYVKSIYDAGARVVVSGSSISEMALHFLERYGMMVIKIVSKFELRRLCRVIGAASVVKAVAPRPEELGYVSSIDVEEIGGTRAIVARQEAGTGVTTVVLRAATNNMMDDVERAIDDGVNAYKAMCKDARLVAGAGAPEIEMASRLAAMARTETGLAQYAIQKYATSLELVPRILAENAGTDATKLVSELYSAHAKEGGQNIGVDIEAGAVGDQTASHINDLYTVKHWAMKLATDAVVTVLRVDQIIMAKQAGGGGGQDKPYK